MHSRNPIKLQDSFNEDQQMDCNSTTKCGFVEVKNICPDLSTAVDISFKKATSTNICSLHAGH
jgi:hypothetical protein